MAKQTINVGTVANDRTGDTLRSAFTKINSNFTELYAAGGASTGSITFEGTAIVGSTGILPQGSIELVPNDGLIPEGQTHAGDTYTSWGQYLNIFPTWDADAPHIHITAGSGENSDGDLFLGNDLKYVQVNHDGTVSINTNPNEWVFDTDGKLTLPSGGTLGLEGMGWPGFSNGTTEQPVSIVYKTNTGNWQAAISLYGGNEEDGLGSINLFTYNAVTSSTYGWTFTENGAVTFPTLTVPISDNANPSGTGQTLKFGDTSQQAIIYGPESTSGNNNAERIIIQGAPGFTGTSGEGGDVYVWAGPGGDANGNGGDIKVRAGQGDGSGAGGYLNFQAGDSSTGNGGYINIESGQSNTYGSGGDITIWAHDGGDIKLRTHNNLTSLDWIFKADGSLQPPAGSLGILKTVQNVSTGGLPAIDIIGNVVFADANAADDHITLLLPQSPPTGAEVTVKNINGGGFSVNVLASTDDSVAIEALDGTISTSTSGVLYGDCHATWVFDGSTWRITNRFTT